MQTISCCQLMTLLTGFVYDPRKDFLFQKSQPQKGMRTYLMHGLKFANVQRATTFNEISQYRH